MNKLIETVAGKEAMGGHTLSEREEGVLTMRFGLDGEGTRTLLEVGKEFGVTRERIRQIEAKALEKIRMLVSRYHEGYLDGARDALANDINTWARRKLTEETVTQNG